MTDPSDQTNSKETSAHLSRSSSLRSPRRSTKRNSVFFTVHEKSHRFGSKDEPEKPHTSSRRFTMPAIPSNVLVPEGARKVRKFTYTDKGDLIDEGDYFMGRKDNKRSIKRKRPFNILVLGEENVGRETLVQKCVDNEEGKTTNILLDGEEFEVTFDIGDGKAFIVNRFEDEREMVCVLFNYEFS